MLTGRYLCNIQQNAFMSREDLVVFPKPRRVGLLSNNIIRPLRFHMRAVNPLAQDARFRDEKLTPVSPNSPFLHPNSSSTGFPSPSSSRGCGRMKFGLAPPAVRVEGFDCLSRDHQNSSIPAMA
ncbi:hypothetical protein HID58_045396 [Brassica napus]|uniref:Uncharacterized protein n=1 Tax=Brassica napus TaxID=3708 RepID=A0ABQ8ATL4_BRANA|nr:hypothetical protein HID58_045396 [Brassica napus]